MQTKRLRVGYVLKRYPRYSETFIVNELLAHEAAGLELEIFSLRAPTDLYFPEQTNLVRAPLHYLPSDGKAADIWDALAEAVQAFSGFQSFLAAARDEGATVGCQALALACQARRAGINHLHAHFATSATAVARLAAKLAGISYSFTAHAKDIFHESVDAGDLQRKLNDAKAVVTVSDFNVDYLRKQYGPSAARVRRIYNGLDLANFPFHDLQGRPPTIVAVGRLVEKKGFADLIEACAILIKRGVRFRCEIIGGGEQEATLASRIAALRLGDRVQLLGPLPQSEVIHHLRHAAILAAPCVVGEDGNRDGLPTVLLEAMSLGTPCVSTDVTGIPEVVRHGETGLVTPQRDPERLADALQRLLTDPNLAARLAKTARRLMEDGFDIHHNTAHIRELFAAGVAGARTNRRLLAEVVG